MKRFYFLSIATLVAGIVGLFSLDASADNHRRVTNSGNTKATGGNGGKAQGKNAQGGAGGAANAKGGSIHTDKKGTTVKNSGNTEAKGGDGGNAKGDGAKGGAGGAATAQGGDIGTPPKKIDPPKKNPVDPGFPKGGNVKNDPKDPKGKNDPKAGGGTGGTAKAGDTTATGGKGGDAQGKGSTGGAGGAATAINGDNNTVINGNVTVNNNITYTPGKGGKGKGKGGMGSGSGGGILSSLLGNLGGQGGGSSGGSSGGDSSGGGFAQGNDTTDATSQGAPGTSIASAPGETVITNDGSPAIAQGANGKDNADNGDADQIFTRRYLKVKNDSGVPMKVYVQYRGQDDKKWAWFPADPSESKNAIVHDLMPGQEMFVQDKGNKLSASRVRIWGVADSQTWYDYRDEDLWVVPEMDQAGVHRYQATEMRTFTFIFPKQEKAASN